MKIENGKILLIYKIILGYSILIEDIKVKIDYDNFIKPKKTRSVLS